MMQLKKCRWHCTWSCAAWRVRSLCRVSKQLPPLSTRPRKEPAGFCKHASFTDSWVAHVNNWTMRCETLDPPPCWDNRKAVALSVKTAVAIVSRSPTVSVVPRVVMHRVFCSSHCCRQLWFAFDSSIFKTAAFYPHPRCRAWCVGRARQRCLAGLDVPVDASQSEAMLTERIELTTNQSNVLYFDFREERQNRSCFLIGWFARQEFPCKPNKQSVRFL